MSMRVITDSCLPRQSASRPESVPSIGSQRRAAGGCTCWVRYHSTSGRSMRVLAGKSTQVGCKLPTNRQLVGRLAHVIRVPCTLSVRPALICDCAGWVDTDHVRDRVAGTHAQSFRNHPLCHLHLRLAFGIRILIRHLGQALLFSADYPG